MASARPSLSCAISTQGFHFSLATTVHVGPQQDLAGCSLHIVHDLGPDVYADQYELAQRPDYNATLWGTSDLERPVSAVDPRGSVLLLTIDPSRLARQQDANVTLEVPLHARYGRLAETSDVAFHTISLKRPLGFFSYPADGESSLVSMSHGLSSYSSFTDAVASVLDVLRPYQSLEGWPTLPATFIPDSAPENQLQLTIPVGTLQDLAWVDIGTALVMIAMFFYVLVASLRIARRLSAKSSRKTE